jgi:hypothetical protein
LLNTDKNEISEFRKEIYSKEEDKSTIIREWFYLEFVESVRKFTKVPLMLTGNILF